MSNFEQIRLAAKVTGDCFSPQQHHANFKFKRNCNYYEQRMLKHPFRSGFHCYAELLHAALLESDPSVTTYVPQPFEWRYAKKRYTPDMYCIRDGRPTIIELKPRAEFSEDKLKAMTAFCHLNGLTFKVIANEAVLAQEQLAENWLSIVQVLVQWQEVNTDKQEYELLEQLYLKQSLSLGDVVDIGNRDRWILNEIALFRLAHKGRAHMCLSNTPLSLETTIEPC